MVGLLSERINGSMHRFEKAGTRSPIIGTYLTNESRHRDRENSFHPIQSHPNGGNNGSGEREQGEEGNRENSEGNLPYP
jgi:hypothetical protein